MSGVIDYSRFPAAVTSDRRRERRAAVIVKDGTARVAVVVPGQGVQIVEEFAVADVVTANRVTTITGQDGTAWTIDKGDGCGCHSPLRTWYRGQLGTPQRAGRG